MAHPVYPKCAHRMSTLLLHDFILPHKGSIHYYDNEIEFSNIINDHNFFTFQ